MPFEDAVANRETAGHGEAADQVLPKRAAISDFTEAARVGDVATLRRMVAGGQNVDATDRYSQTALMRAAQWGHLDAVAFLVGQGADLNRTAKFGLSALMLAVINRHHEIVRALVRAGADTELRGRGAPGFIGKTAADLAADAGDIGLAAEIRREGTGS